MYKYLLIIFALSQFTLVAQNQKFVIDLEPSALIVKETFPDLSKDGKVFPVFNSDSSKLLLFLSTPLNLSAIYLDDQMRELNFIETELPEEKRLTKMDGGLYGGDDNYYAFFSDRKKVNFSCFRINAEEGEIFSNDFNLTLNKEKYLHSFSANGYYYIVAVPIYSSEVNIYRINKTLKIRKTTYDFSDVSFDSTNPRLFDEINEYIMKGNHRLSRISLKDPISTASTASFFKIYYNDQMVRLSFDHVIGRTTILEMELNSRLKTSYQVFAPSYVLAKSYSYTSNSAIIDDVLFNFITGGDMMSIVVHELETGDMVAEHIRGKNDKFDLINEPVHYDGLPLMGSTKTPRRFLKLIEGQNLGIAVNNHDKDNWVVSFGAANRPIKDLSEHILVTIGMEDIEDTTSPTYLAFQEYELSKKVMARGLFNKYNFDHTEGKINYEPFDHIDVYISQNLNGFEVLETVFQLNGRYYHGSYYTDSRKYTIVKF